MTDYIREIVKYIGENPVPFMSVSTSILIISQALVIYANARAMRLPSEATANYAKTVRKVIEESAALMAEDSQEFQRRLAEDSEYWQKRIREDGEETRRKMSEDGKDTLEIIARDGEETRRKIRDYKVS